MIIGRTNIHDFLPSDVADCDMHTQEDKVPGTIDCVVWKFGSLHFFAAAEHCRGLVESFSTFVEQLSGIADDIDAQQASSLQHVDEGPA